MKKLTLFVNDDCVCVSVTAYTKKKDLDKYVGDLLLICKDSSNDVAQKNLDNNDEEQVKAVKLLKNWRYK